jgi:phage terminase large subunit-like protein
MGMNLRTSRWAGADFWEAAAGEVTLDIILAESEVVVIGIDGGGLDDLLGLAVIGRDAKQRDLWRLWTRAWAHPLALERRKSEAARYRDFEKDGDLIIVEEIGEDIKQVGEIVMRCEKAGLLDRIGVDPVGIGGIVDEVQGGGIEFDRVVGIPQGYRLSGAIKTLERRLAAKSILHGGQKMMAWVVGNARVETKGNAVLITKQASGTGKIDPLVASFNAVALMAMNPEPKRVKSIYEGLTIEQIKARMAY